MQPETKAKIQDYTDLVAWQKSHAVVLQIYKVVSTFPSEEKYGLSSQMTRAAVSVPSNIAEGFGRWSQKEKDQFYSIASGSMSELQTQLLIAKDVSYITEIEFDAINKEIINARKLIYGLRRANKSKGE